MSNRFTLVSIGLVAPVTFLIGLAVAGSFAPLPAVGDRSVTAEYVPAAAASSPVRSPAPALKTADAAIPRPVNFADVADRINAAVVNIDASIAGSPSPHAGLRRPDDLPDPPGVPDDSEPRQGAGSGFIIDRDGYILTNHHLVDGAERLVVTLADGRSYRATVVGVDPAIDVALIKIPGSPSLPAAPLGDSDGLRVGEWVCAIGNPLGYVHSVTVGVVSFMGRKLFDRSLDDYIQTDAAINFGNSGGPLINARGEVIGINSAISSRANNIGFAVPINQARAILPQLKTRGRVSRGFIGIVLTDVTPDLQRSLHLAVSRGALVQDIAPNSPGERAGIRAYDVVTAVDGQTIWTNDELIREISARPPGSAARLRVVRDGHERSMIVKLAERPTHEETGEEMTSERPREADQPRTPERRVGLTVREIDTSIVRRLSMPGVQGVVITRIDPTGPAFGTPALRRGQIILEINRQQVSSVNDFNRLVSAARAGDVLALYVFDPAVRQRSVITVALDTP